MNKTQLIGLIKSRIASLEKKTNKLDSSIYDSIPGFLIISTIRGKDCFYHVTEEDGCRRKTYLTDEKTIGLLSNKRYLEKLRDAAEKELKALRFCLGHLESSIYNSDVEKVYDSLPRQIKGYVVPDAITDEGFAAAWQAKKVICGRKTSAHTVKTLRGEYVRSKSEALIADRFYSLGIPYIYEQRFIVDEMTEFYLHPDFTVLNKRTRKEYFWEHCGMIDDSKYGNVSVDKLVIYSSKGYLQGKNLIFTYETREKPLNLDYVDRLIAEFLV